MLAEQYSSNPIPPFQWYSGHWKHQIFNEIGHEHYKYVLFEAIKLEKNPTLHE